MNHLYTLFSGELTPADRNRLKAVIRETPGITTLMKEMLDHSMSTVRDSLKQQRQIAEKNGGMV